MLQDDDKTFNGFNDILVGIALSDDASAQGDEVALTFNKTPLADDKLLANVFGSSESNDIKKISDNNQPLVKNKSKSYHAGHRQRARDRFMRAPSASTDVELLELLLFTIIPRADTRETAYNLINKFGNLRNVYNAPVSQLNESNVNGENLKYAFALCQAIMARILKNKMEEKSVFESKDSVFKYCKIKLGALKEEEFHVLFLDNKLRLIKDCKFGIENVNDVVLHLRRIMQSTIELHSCNVILTHNHPSGDCSPSQTDMNTTKEIKQLLKSIDVKLLDHIIVTGDRHYSFRENYLLEDD